MRPNTDQILELPYVMKRVRKYFSRDGMVNPAIFDTQEAPPTDSELLRTIRLSKNVFKLSLPEPAYAQNVNFQTIPGSQVTNANRNNRVGSNSQSKSPQGTKMNVMNNITKTTAITTTKQSVASKNIENDVNISLPNIKGKKSNLASIDDDYEEDYDERVPQKPKNMRRSPTHEDLEGAQSSISPKRQGRGSVDQHKSSSTG